MIAGLDNCIGFVAVIIDTDLQMPVNYINNLDNYWINCKILISTYRKNKKSIKNAMVSKYYDFFNDLSSINITKML